MVYGQFFQEKNKSSHRFHVDDPLGIQQLSNALFPMLPERTDTQTVIVCIGSDRSTGDSLGPLIGTKLSEKNCPFFHIYGTLSSPVHAKNLEETLAVIHSLHQDPFIIAVDACLGKTESVGMMTVSEGPVRPGAAVKKNLPPVGHIHLTGIVNVGGHMEMLVLQNTRLSLVMSMADAISRAIWRTACWQTNRQEVLYPSKI